MTVLEKCNSAYPTVAEEASVHSKTPGSCDPGVCVDGSVDD